MLISCNFTGKSWNPLELFCNHLAIFACWYSGASDRRCVPCAALPARECLSGQIASDARVTRVLVGSDKFVLRRRLPLSAGLSRCLVGTQDARFSVMQVDEGRLRSAESSKGVFQDRGVLQWHERASAKYIGGPIQLSRREKSSKASTSELVGIDLSTRRIAT